LLATYHNHSTWSDGKASIAEILDAARGMNIGELGISDHWVLHPRKIQQKWAMPTERLSAYLDDLRALREASAHQNGPVVRIGLEVDWFPGHGDPVRDALAKLDFDYLIGSVHEIEVPGLNKSQDRGEEPTDHASRKAGEKVGGFMIDGSPAAWRPLTQDQRNDIHRCYWQHMKTLGESGLVDIIAHIDLPKKFAFYPTIDLSREIGEALDAIAAARTTAGGRLVVEINTAGWHKPCSDAYPTIDIVRACKAREIPVTISADAHQPEHLLRDFKRAADRLADAGYDQVARFAQREVRFEPLAEAAQ
jgi:histidinol-phosphatase (PHP family)